MSTIYNHAIDKVKGWRKSGRYLQRLMASQCKASL